VPGCHSAITASTIPTMASQVGALARFIQLVNQRPIARGNRIASFLSPPH
jgi:hypothetical protein